MNKIPKLRFPEFSGEWEEKKFNEITEITRLAGYEYSQYWKEDQNKEIIALRGYNIGKNKLNLRDLGYISNELSMRLIRSRLNKGDIVYPCVGSIGNACVIEENDKYHIQQNIAKITCNKDNSPYFLVQFLTSFLAMKEVEKFNATTSQPNVLVGSLREFQINAPSLPEQEEIASFLSSVDSKIEKLERKKELWEQYKKGMMQKIFSQELRFRDENGEDYPEWEEKSLGEISDIRSGLNLDQNTESRGYKVTRIETISSTRIDLDKIGFVETEKNIEEYRLWEGDLLFSNINSVSHIGKMSYVDRNYDLYHGMNLLKIKVNNLNSSKYCYYLLTSKRYKQHFESVCSQAVNQASINQTELKKTILNLPSLPEQKQITEFLSSLDSKIEIVEKELLGMKEFKKGLLQKMFV